MSQLANRTQKSAIRVLAQMLPYFGKTDLLFMSAEDAYKARDAENTLRGIIENNGYTADYRKGKGTRLLKSKL